MKNRMTLSTLSLLVLGVFGYLATGYLNPTLVGVKTKHLGGGIYRETTTSGYTDLFGDSIVIEKSITGARNDAGEFQGDVTIEEVRSDGTHQMKETCHMVYGLRHGKSLTYIGNDSIPVQRCYDNGYLVKCGGLTQTETRGASAFEILDASYPWFLIDENTAQAKALVEDYLDAIEARLANQPVNPWDFESYYSDVIDSLEEEGNYTWQEQFLEARYNPVGVSLVKRFTYRLALLDRYREGMKPSGQIVKERYPGLEADLLLFGATEEEIADFFADFDIRMAADGPLDTQDPLFIDSIDQRMYRVLVAYLEEGITSTEIQQFLAPPFNGSIRPEKLKPFLLGSDGLVASPADNGDMAFAMVILMAVQFDSGDPVRAAVRKAWFANHQEPMPPTLVSQLVDDPTTAGIEMRGHIYEDGGADVLERGFVWDTTYLPDLEKAHVVALGSGTGEFTTVLNGLEVGKRYFARGYAVNQGGVAYGNLFEFTVQEISSVDGVDHRVALNLFPNPVRSELFLRMEDIVPGPVQIRVSDLQGRIVREEILGNPGPDGTVQLDVSALPQGAYLLQVRSDGRLGAQRFIKER